jgi:hypothetical protein
MADPMLITIQVSKDRERPGQLSVGDFACPCLCLADRAAAEAAGNPSRNPLLEDGDTPAGRYMAVVGTVKTPEHSYGLNPVIRLIPASGDALGSERTGLLVHGGPPNASGQLRPTHGCIRVADDDQAELVRRMNLNCGRAFLEVVEV